MAKRLLPPDWHVTKDNGDPANDATILVRIAGTSTPTPAYSDKELATSLGSTINCDATGYPASGGNDVALWGADTISYDLIVQATGYNGGASKTLEDVAVADDAIAEDSSSALALGNAFDNGGFEAWSYGTSFSNVSGDGDGDQVADGWYLSQSTAASNAVSRQAGFTVEDFASSRYCLRFGRPNGSTSTNELRLWKVAKPEVCYRLRGQEVVLRYSVKVGGTYSGNPTGDGFTFSVRLATGTTESEDGDLIATNGFAGHANAVNANQAATKNAAQRYEHIVTLPNNIKEIGILFAFAGGGTADTTDHLEIQDVELKLATDPEEFHARPEILDFLLSNLTDGGRALAATPFSFVNGASALAMSGGGFSLTGGAFSASQGAAATTPSGTFVNSNDNASVRVLRIEGDRATPANNDTVYASFFLSDSAGNQDEVARLSVRATNVTSGGESGQFRFGVMVAGAAVADIFAVTTTSITPITNDGLTLGSGTLSFADVFLASGGVINWANGDVTLTHSSDALAMAGGEFSVSNATAATTPAANFTNSNDSASVQVARFQGDRATPANNDAAYISLYLSDASGNQDEAGRIFWQNFNVTNGAESTSINFYTMNGGAIGERVIIGSGAFRTSTNDQMTLGTTLISWADIFVASGAVYNAANGNATITHITGGFEVGGTWRARTALSTETSGTLTSASANKRVKATAGVTINDGVFTAEDAIEIYNDSDVSITITQDTGMTLRLAGTTSTGNRTLAARGVAYVYFDTNADAAVAGSGVS
jgi:hypothetical protein